MTLPKINLNRKKRTLVGILIIALSIPVTLALIRVSQELRRRAAPPLPKATIRGTVFEDIDGNSTLSEGEPGLLGVVIILKDRDGNYLSETTTNDGGYFDFTELDPGSYILEKIVPEGYKNTTPISVEVNGLEKGQEREVVFGSRSVPPPGKGRISGYEWDDQNGNGVWDADEFPCPERILVTLSGTTSQTDLTDEAGYFEFDGLEPGSYIVEETVPEGWRATTGTSFVINLSIGGDEAVAFGNTSTDRSQTKIFGHKFNDVNGNGSWDITSEPGIGKATITLKDSDGNIVSSTETLEGADLGYYHFENLEPGTYIVTEAADSFEVMLRMGEAKRINFGNTTEIIE